MEVKSGDKFGVCGWWVNKDLAHPKNLLLIEDSEDKVPGSTHRLIYVYYGETKPSTDQMKELIKNTVFENKDANY